MHHLEEQQLESFLLIEEYMRKRLVTALPKDSPVKEVSVVLRLNRRDDLEVRWMEKHIEMLYCRVFYDEQAYDYAIAIKGTPNDIDFDCLTGFANMAIKANKNIDCIFSPLIERSLNK